MTNLATIQSGWDQAARDDAMFNILTLEDKRGGRWTAEEFFEHGRAEIGAALERLDSLGIEYGTHHALDFGCGVGRLTQALADYFMQVDGVDISWEMINLAERYSKFGQDVVHYYTNSRPNLSLFESGRYDLVYTMIVLQHMPPTFQREYVREFFRVLKPGGVAMFEIPDGPGYKHPDEWLSMYGVPRRTVEKWIAEDGGRLVDVELIPDPGPWDCLRYTAVAS